MHKNCNYVNSQQSLRAVQSSVPSTQQVAWSLQHINLCQYYYRNFRTCCCTASVFSNLIPPLCDSFRGPSKWKSLDARSGLYKCVADVSKPSNTSWQFSVWFDESYDGTHDPGERLHSRMLQPGSSSTGGDPNTSPMHWSAFTGFAFQTESSSRWPRWHFVLCTVRHRLTWRLSLLALLTYLTGEGCGLHRLISLMFHPSTCQLLAVVLFRLLVIRSGTAYQMMSPRSDPVNLPAPFEDILILLLLQHCLTLLVLTLTIVVLVVALLLRPL